MIPVEAALATVYLISAAFHLVIGLATHGTKSHVRYALLLFSFLALFALVFHAPGGIPPPLRSSLTMLLVWVVSVSTCAFLDSAMGLTGLGRFIRLTLGLDLGLSLTASAILLAGHPAAGMILYYGTTLAIVAVFAVLLSRECIRRSVWKDRTAFLAFAGFMLNVPSIAVLFALFDPAAPAFVVACSIGLLPTLACFECSLAFSIIETRRRASRLEETQAVKRAERERELRGLFKQYRLTPREQEVCTILLSGQSDKDVAESLGITYNTARNIRRSIYNKVDARSLGELLSRFMREKTPS